MTLHAGCCLDVDAVGLPFDRARQRDILDAGLDIMSAINEQDPPKHPEIDGVDHCHHVEFIAPGSVPTITGRAWVTGLGQYMLDPADPYPTGIEF